MNRKKVNPHTQKISRNNSISAEAEGDSPKWVGGLWPACGARRMQEITPLIPLLVTSKLEGVNNRVTVVFVQHTSDQTKKEEEILTFKSVSRTLIDKFFGNEGKFQFSQVDKLQKRKVSESHSSTTKQADCFL
eukprot:g18372.t1